MSARLNQARNYNFDEAVGATPTFYSLQTTASSILRLALTDPFEHPERQIVLPGEDPYVIDGRATLRARMTAAAAADDFRAWPGARTAGAGDPEFNVAFLGPWRIVTGTNDQIRMTEVATATAVVAAGFYASAGLAAALKTAMEAATASANTYTWSYDIGTRLWAVTRAAGADAITIPWTDPLTTAEALLGFTADDVGATTYTADQESGLAIPGYWTRPAARYQFRVRARSSVAGSLLRVRVVTLDHNWAVYRFLNSAGVWQATDAFWAFGLGRLAEDFGMTFEIPSGARHWLWQVSNGSAGARDYDLGGVWAWEMTGQRAVA